MKNPASHVYVHVPFCARRCSYCDFAIAVRREVPVRDYLAALDAELLLRVPTTGAPHHVDTVYLGGGTPSLLGAAGVAELMQLLRRYFQPAPNAEVTLEANPEDVSSGAVDAWRAAGINRVSLGVQSFDDRVLEWMHRVHDAACARRAARTVARAGFGSWSLDLIFALPEELSRDWPRDLAQALELNPPHVSTYGLTVEPHTPLAKWVARGDTSDATDVGYEGDFFLAHEELNRAGLRHYEVSNYARPGHTSRHNSAYWIGAPYFGVGPSAHSFAGAERRWNIREYQAWSQTVVGGGDPMAGSEVLNHDQKAIERIYLGLRSSTGIRIDDAPPEIVEKWCQQGWAMRSESRLALTAAGWLRLDALVTALTAYSTHC